MGSGVGENVGLAVGILEGAPVGPAEGKPVGALEGLRVQRLSEMFRPECHRKKSKMIKIHKPARRPYGWTSRRTSRWRYGRCGRRNCRRCYRRRSTWGGRRNTAEGTTFSSVEYSKGTNALDDNGQCRAATGNPERAHDLRSVTAARWNIIR